MRALDLAPDQRYQSAEEMKAALIALLETQPLEPLDQVFTHDQPVQQPFDFRRAAGFDIHQAADPPSLRITLLWLHRPVLLPVLRPSKHAALHQESRSAPEVGGRPGDTLYR